MKKLCLFLLFVFAVICFSDVITGIVVTTDKKPVSGAKVSIFNSQNPQSPVKTVFSDKNGKFRFDSLETGYYKIVVSKNKFCDSILSKIEVNQPKFGIVNYEIVLARPGSISGYIYDPEGNPVVGAEVIVGNKRARTDSKGYYKVDGLNPGYYYMYVTASDFVREDKRSVLVKEGEVTSDINFTLSYAGKVKGIVVDMETGEPLPGVHVSCCSGPYYVSGTTDASGKFLISGLKGGSYWRVYFDKQGYESSSANFEAIVKKTVDIGTIRLKIRKKYFYPVNREWIFTPDEKISIYFNAFRIPSVLIEVYEVDLLNILNRAKGTNLPLRDILSTSDISGENPILSKKFDISYPTPLSELYDRKIIIGNLPEGVYICTIKPEGLSEQRIWFIVSDIGFISKSFEGKGLFTVFSISKGNVLKDVPVYLFNNNWEQVGQIKTDSCGQFNLINPSKFIIKYGKSFAFSDLGRVGYGGSYKPRSIYAFTDRPVYRPNQTVYFKAILRIDEGNTYRIPDISNVSVKIISPDNTVIYETNIKPTLNGSLFGEWTIPDEPPLGVYTIRFSTNGKDTIDGEFRFVGNV